MDIKKLIRKKLNESHKEKIVGTKVFGHKLAQCDLNFLQMIKEMAKLKGLELNDSETQKIFRVYLNAKVIKRDTANCTWKVKSGVFWDRIPLENALIQT